MNTKEEYFNNIQRWVFNFNPYWEDPLENTKLITDTEETCEIIKSYCGILDIRGKKIKERGDYEKYPEDVKKIISDIISLVCDDRDLRHKVLYKNVPGNRFNSQENCKIEREFDHHFDKNGYLHFENNPFRYTSNIVRECNGLLMVLKSEANTVNLSKYIGKIFDFNGYENGSVVAKIEKINWDSDKKEFTFDGKCISYVNENNSFGDGIVFFEAENYCFSELPYSDEFETEKELDEWLSHKKVITIEDAIKQAHNAIFYGFEKVFGINYKMK